VDFSLASGSMATVTGPSASGKSTFVNVLRLALVPTGGRALILGADAQSLTLSSRAILKRQIGYLAQEPALLGHMTAFENVSLPLRLAGAKLESYAEDVEELLHFVGLPENDRRTADTMSGSERRRAAVARAVVGRPRLILVEDPVAGLSADSAGRVLRLLATMRRAGSAVIVTSQDEGVAEEIGGEHWRLKEGRLAPATEREFST
jgi:cell division transport system ATP-binding protein